MLERRLRFPGKNQALWVVVNGYGFGAEYQEALKSCGAQSVVHR